MSEHLWHAVTAVRWQDAVDIALITFLLAKTYSWLRGTVALQIAFGMLAILAGAFVARELGLMLTSYLLQGFGAVATLIAVVVFRDEIRRALSLANPLGWLRRRRHAADAPRGYGELAAACFALARRRIGAIIVLPGSESIRDHISGGTEIDAAISSPIIESLFLPSGPVHDGALVIEGKRIRLAGAVLPLSHGAELPERCGTRHRAALGLSEACDAAVICVSEERGKVSLAHGGRLRELDDEDALAHRLLALSRDSRRAETSSEASGTWARHHSRRDALAYLLIAAGVIGSWYAMGGSRDQVMALHVPLEFRGLPDSMALAPPATDKVLIELSGPRRILDALPPGSARAYIDLSEAAPGHQEMPVAGSAPGGVKVVGVVPSKMRVEVLERRTLPVRAALGPTFPSRFEIAAVTPESVQAIGPPLALEGVEALHTAPVEAADLEGRVARVRLRVPPGLRLADQREQEITVLVRQARRTPIE
jgi:diadenylate cyclase